MIDVLLIHTNASGKIYQSLNKVSQIEPPVWALMLAGNLAVTEAGGSLVDYYWEIYHNMGDPSLITYMGIPIENNVSII